MDRQNLGPCMPHDSQMFEYCFGSFSSRLKQKGVVVPTQTVLLSPPVASLKASISQGAPSEAAPSKAAPVQERSALDGGASIPSAHGSAKALAPGTSDAVAAHGRNDAIPARGMTDAVAEPDAPAVGGVRSLHLTRRGRLVFIGLPLMLTAAAALALLGFFTAPAMASSGSPEVTRTVQVSVAEGESLWGLAQDFAPDRDPRDVVAEIMELNNLSDAKIPVGAQLFIPVEG